MTCDLCMSPRRWLTFEVFKTNNGSSSIRIRENRPIPFTTGIALPACQSRIHGKDERPLRTYSICANGHISPDSTPNEISAPRYKVCILGPVGAGKSQLLHAMLSLTPPSWETAPQPQMTPRTVSRRSISLPYGALRSRSPNEIRATVQSADNNLRQSLIRFIGSFGIQTMSFSYHDNIERGLLPADALERLLEHAIAATPAHRANPEQDELVAQDVADWGRWRRSPFLSEVDVYEGNADNTKPRTHCIAWIDLPGEATSQWAVPDENPYVGSQDDLDQMSASATFLGVVDPVSASWCFKRITETNNHLFELSQRATQQQDTHDLLNNTRQRVQNSNAIAKEMIASLASAAIPRTTDIAIAITKCDVIRALLESADLSRVSDRLGLRRWSALMTEREQADFIVSATTALRCLSRRTMETPHESNEQALAFLTMFSRASLDEQRMMSAQILSHMSAPEAFWAVTSTGEPFSFAVNGADFTVLSSDATWNRGLGRERLQMRDIVTTIIGSALVASVVGKNRIEGLLEVRPVSFALTSAWERIDVDGSEIIIPGDGQAGCYQVLRQILAPALGMAN